ncbi:hypothetical protein CL3_03040 [butyrate-producing bacterium SM4/1]|nr:hypothetical protein CL3_03040 [butyrate-producing bacterium SM4/1]
MDGASYRKKNLPKLSPWLNGYYFILKSA